jgi:hypothetical protein
MARQNSFGHAGGVSLAESVRLRPGEECVAILPDGVGAVLPGFVTLEEGELDEPGESFEMTLATSPGFFELLLAALRNLEVIHCNKHGTDSSLITVAPIRRWNSPSATAR